MHHVLYLANGQQTRFGPLNEPKQLLGIYGVPLLVGTMAKFARRVDRQYVVTTNPVIKDMVGVSAVDVGPTEGLQATILATRHLWGTTRTTYLFGDCYYTDAAVARIANCQKVYAHVGRTHASRLTGKPYGESFAITWTPAKNAAMAKALSVNPAGTSWDLYRAMAKLDDLPDGVNYLNESPACLIRIDDFTDDFDTWEDYARWFELFLLHEAYEQQRAVVLQKYAAQVPA